MVALRCFTDENISSISLTPNWLHTQKVTRAGGDLSLFVVLQAELCAMFDRVTV